MAESAQSSSHRLVIVFKAALNLAISTGLQRWKKPNNSLLRVKRKSPNLSTVAAISGCICPTLVAMSRGLCVVQARMMLACVVISLHTRVIFYQCTTEIVSFDLYWSNKPQNRI